MGFIGLIYHMALIRIPTINAIYSLDGNIYEEIANAVFTRVMLKDLTTENNTHITHNVTHRGMRETTPVPRDPFEKIYLDIFARFFTYE